MTILSSAIGLRDEFTRIQSAKHCSKERAFLEWYLGHNFERTADFQITDGPNDGGIDAIVQLKKGGKLAWTTIQSKYCEDIFRGRQPSPLSISSYMEFDGLLEIFTNKSMFEEYIKSVDPSLHTLYRELANNVQRGQEVTWQLTTLHSRSRGGESRLRNLDVSCFRYAADNLFLYDLCLVGAEPPADPMELKFADLLIFDDPHRRVKSYVLRAYLRDFVDYTDKDPNFRVLARNVRSDLKSDINEAIRETYEKWPDEFWYSHNGITMICKDAIVKGKSIRMIAPSIINGAQTIHALRKSRRRDPNAQLLVRVIEIPWKEEEKAKAQAHSLINKIIFRTNQQNRMYKYDLRTNDPLQVSLARQFLEKRIFYERKRGEWDLNKRPLKNQGLRRLTIKQLAQILCACDEQAGGVSTAKRTIEELFSDKRYEYVFEPRFPEIFLKLNLYDFLTDCLYCRTRWTSWTETKQELLTSLSVFWHSIESAKQIEDWEQALLNKPSVLSPWNRNCRPLVNAAKRVFKACWKLWKSKKRKDKTLTPKNFFRSEEWNTGILNRFVPKFRVEIVRAFSKALD